MLSDNDSAYKKHDAQVTVTSAGATQDEWNAWLKVAGAADLLPVVSDQSVPISPTSAIKALGKTPSDINSSGYAHGIVDWTSKVSTVAAVGAWARKRELGICLQTRHLRALDIDVTAADQARAIEATLRQLLPGEFRARRRSNSSKFLVLVKVAPGEVLAKRVIKVNGGIIEFLATGQQAVVAGAHPSGARIEWDGGVPTVFPVLSLEAFDTVWNTLVDRFAVEPPTQGGVATRKSEPNLDMDDGLADYIRDHGLVLGASRDGGLHVQCPWHDGHSSGSDGDGSTTYFPAGTKGYDHGSFICLHASCQGKRATSAFRRAIGYTQPRDPDADFGAFMDAVVQPPISKPGKVQPLRTYSPKELRERPRAQWLIHQVLADGGLGLLYGPSGVGKSFVVLDIALAVARGIDWHGKRVKQGGVLYIAAEGGNGFGQRLDAYSRHHNTSIDETPFRLVPEGVDLLTGAGVDVPRILNACAAVPDGVRLIVLDTLNRVMPGGNENSPDAMGSVIAAAGKLTAATGAFVLIIHHPGKDAEKGARGHSSMFAAMDTVIEVKKDGNLRLIEIRKQRDGADDLRFAVTLSTVDLGVNEETLESVRVPVVVETAVPAKKSAKPLGRPGVWVDLVCECLSSLGYSDLIDEESLIEEVSDLHHAKTGKASARARDMAKRALVSAEERGFLVREAGKIKAGTLI